MRESSPPEIMPAMKALVLNGSPRRGGGTASLSRSFAEGLRRCLGPSSQVEVLDLVDYHIEACRGCRLCFDRGEDACPLEDDLPWLKERLLESGLIVLASPVYVDAMSGLMKTLVDRLAWLCHRPLLGGKVAYVLTTTGSMPSAPTARSLRKALGFWGARTAGSLCLLAGEKLSLEALALAAPRVEAAAQGLAKKALDGHGTRPGLADLVIFHTQRQFWLRQDKDSFDRRWWLASGLLEPGRAWRSSPARLGRLSLGVARGAASVIALIMWGPGPGRARDPSRKRFK